MLPEVFNNVVDEQIKICKDTLGVKAEEYSSDIDRLHNFRISAEMQHCTMQQALGGMMAKHTVSIYDLIASEDNTDLDIWNEKIKDHINYLLLLKAILIEQSIEVSIQSREAERA